MAARRPSTSPDQNIPSLALLRRHVQLAKHLYKQTKELDTFAPRKFIGVFSGKQIFRILEVEELIPDLIERGMYQASIIETRNQYMSKRLGLPEPFPSSPTRPPKYGIKFIRGREVVAHINFCELYAGHRILTTILEDTPYKWESDNEIEADLQHLLIRGDQKDLLTLLMEYEPSSLQQAWELPFPYPAMIRAIRRNNYVPPVTHFADTLSNTAPAQLEPTSSPRSTIERPKKQRAERTAGAVTISEIAKQMNIEPSHARAALRKAGVEKSSSGWEWQSDMVPSIKKKIEEQIHGKSKSSKG